MVEVAVEGLLQPLTEFRFQSLGRACCAGFRLYLHAGLTDCFEVALLAECTDHDGGPVHAYRVGQALAPLTEQGWLIVASGNITHNLRDWQRASAGMGIDTSYASPATSTSCRCSPRWGIRDHVIAMDSYAFAQPA